MVANVAIRGSRVLIIGAGFGGLSAAKSLARGPFDVTLIDRYNYHLFQPLLYQVATAALSPSDITSPIRTEFHRRPNVRVMLANVSEVDTGRNEVVAEGRRIPFHYLVVATGAQQSYFGHADWAQDAPGLKTIDDAIYLRRRILLAFERAEIESDPDERRRLLNFVVVGGGATGVELVGAIAELAKRALASDFRTIDPRSARIILVEAGSRVLSQFDETLSRSAQRALERLGAEVRVGTAVTGCDEQGISMGKERIESRTVIWAAGVEASPAGRWLGAETDRAGRIKVQPDLSLPGRPHIFAIGDTASSVNSEGRPLPGVAPVAKQQGAYVARVISARAAGRSIPPFRYRDYGMLATIGRSHAVAELRGIKISGFAAWLLWCFAHIYFLIGYRNRLIVMLNWAWNFVTFQRGARLITGIVGARMKDLKQMSHAEATGGTRREMH
ncbi:MAG: NAD(P)/FAD-dependent oxidoreductase [Xanthobacteraceae bacterium]